MKQFLNFLFIGLSVTLLLSGCGNSSDDAEASVDKLTVQSVELK